VTLDAVAAKVSDGARLTREDALTLYRSHDLLTIGRLADLANRRANGNRVFQPETIEFATKVRSKDHHRDVILDIPVNRALSVIVAGDDGNAFMRGFGRCTSPRAFGHGGAGGQMGWGDPETGISLGFCTNGFNDYLTIGRRITAISSLAASCAT